MVGGGGGELVSKENIGGWKEREVRRMGGQVSVSP